MIIRGIGASLPDRCVGNEEVIDLIRQHSQKTFCGDLERLLAILLKLLQRTGLEQRRWCARHESPIDHVARAVRIAMQGSYLRLNQIELLIYVGVGRGFLEPSNAHMMASALGFDNAECFDVTDACMSWIRALHLVNNLFKTGSYKNAMVINAEFNMQTSTPDFVLHNAEQLAYTFPAFTIGEAATATLLTPQAPENFEFHFSSRPDLADLCTIPLPGYEEFCHPTDRIGKNNAMHFTSFGEELHKAAYNESVKVFNRLSNKKALDAVFVHASSKKAWDEFGAKIGVRDKIHHVYHKTGNLVSASIPAAIFDAIESGALVRGNQLALWVGSAGMSFSAARLGY